VKRFVAIESLRGWMAWWVVAAHALDVSGADTILPKVVAKILGQAGLPVQIFMIVSGFVIAHLLIGRREPFGEYLQKRWFRVFPLFAFMLVFAIVLSYGFDLYRAAWINNPYAGDVSGRVSKMESEHNSWLTHLLLHLSLMHGVVADSVLPYASTTFLSPAWSLSLEWQFYVVAPLMVVSLQRIRAAWFCLLLLVGSAGAFAGWFGEWWDVPAYLLLGISLFFAGITSRLWLDGKTPWLGIVSTGVALLIFCVSEGLKPSLYLVAAGAIWCLFLVATAKEVGVVKFSSRSFDMLFRLIAYNSTVIALGRVSYSTYLSHVPVMSLVIGIGVIAADNHSHSWIVSLTMLAVVLTVPASFLLYHWVEKPGVQLGKRLFPGSTAGKRSLSSTLRV